MKKIIMFLAAALIANPVLRAQGDTSVAPKMTQHESHKNMVELNLLALGLKNISVQYQRQISKKITIGSTVRLMPESTLPFESSIRGEIHDSTAKSQLDNFRMGNFSIMPEIRFYLGRRGAFHGFYIAPFFSYAHYTARLPYNYTNNGNDQTILISGSLNSITGGIRFGAQWKLARSVYLDWWIFGPHYGSSKGSLSGKQSLSSSDQSSLKSSLDDLNIPLVKTTNTVDANGATLNLSGPWAGVRAGLCIAFQF